MRSGARPSGEVPFLAKVGFEPPVQPPNKLLPYRFPQLIDLFRSEDVDVVMSTTVYTAHHALEMSRVLLLKRIDTQDLGILAAAVNCVLGRCCKRFGRRVSVVFVQRSVVAGVVADCVSSGKVCQLLDGQ